MSDPKKTTTMHRELFLSSYEYLLQILKAGNLALIFDQKEIEYILPPPHNTESSDLHGLIEFELSGHCQNCFVILIRQGLHYLTPNNNDDLRFVLDSGNSVHWPYMMAQVPPRTWTVPTFDENPSCLTMRETVIVGMLKVIDQFASLHDTILRLDQFSETTKITEFPTAQPASTAVSSS